MSASPPTPLAGKTILDLSSLVPGPYCSSLLQAFGARVMKIETVTGDPLRKMSPALFAQLNRGKLSITLDLKSDQDREKLLKLVEQSDGVIEGFRPGVIDRLGLDYATLTARNPAIVLCSLSGFGQDGPYRDRPAHDINILGLAGYYSVPSQLNGAITRPNIRLADFIPGQTAAMSIAMAIVSAEKTGEGSHIDCSMFDCTANWSLPFMLASRERAPEVPADYPHVMADSAIFETRDGKFLTLGTLEDKFWINLVGVIGKVEPQLADPQYATRRGRDGNKQMLFDLLAACFKQKDFAEWEALLHEIDTAWGPVYQSDEVLADDHLQARALIDEASGSCNYPALFSGTRPSVPGTIPELGQHNADLLP